MNGETDKAYDRLKSKQERSEKAKGVLRGAGYARGGGVSPAKKAKVKMEDDDLPKKKVGKVGGSKTSQRADKFARGGSIPKGHHTKININVGAGQAEKAAAMQQGVKMGATMAAQKLGAGGPRPGAGAPPMARPPMPPPGGAPPPRPMMPPAGGAPMGPPPGGPPMANRGGAFKRGGKVTNLTKGGGGGARGRLEKIAKYGTKPKA